MDKFGLDKVISNLARSQREVLVLLSNQASKYFLDSFTKQSWDGQSWKQVQRRESGTKAYKYPKTKGLQRRTSPILVGAGYKTRGGTLRRAVSTMARTAEVSSDKVRMIVDLPYAQRHNEGLDMPKRTFVGQTDDLTRMQIEKIKEIMDKIWQR